jgi:riboflavin biosynthesis pyrimidine reductase
MVQALANWSGQIRSNDVHLLRDELDAVLAYAAKILEDDVQTRNELCIARSLLALNQIFPALQRLERTVLADKQLQSSAPRTRRGTPK